MCGVSPSSAANIVASFLKNLMVASHLPPDMAYLACYPSKLVRAKTKVMTESREWDFKSQNEKKIIGIGYDGMRDCHTRAMITDSALSLELLSIEKSQL